MKNKIMVGCLLNFLTNFAFADLTMVEDKLLIDQAMKINDYLGKLDGLKEVNQEIQNQIKTNLNGNFKYGAFQNGDSENALRKITPNSWSDALSQNSHGNDAYNAAYNNYKKIYAINASDKIAPSLGQNNLIRNHYERSTEVNRAALAASEASFDQINKHIETLSTMLKELDTHPEEKAASELNARLVAEIGFIQLETLRQQTIQNQLMAMQSQGSVNGRSDQADFLNMKGAK